CYIDAERKRTFTMMIREGVATHAFNGELFTQPCWEKEQRRIFRTQFKMVSPKRISNPFGQSDSNELRAGVRVSKAGAAMGYYVSDDSYPDWSSQQWTYVPRELVNGRPAMIHVFEPKGDGQTRGANQFYSAREQMKMLDAMQKTHLQGANVKAFYALTIESELDSESAMEFLLGAGEG
ncbi:phage portal protein, partial [Acinetobacter baumannii]|nr:phage portal protein [Acinetobacter baumannii]